MVPAGKDTGGRYLLDCRGRQPGCFWAGRAAAHQPHCVRPSRARYAASLPFTQMDYPRGDPCPAALHLKVDRCCWPLGRCLIVVLPGAHALTSAHVLRRCGKELGRSGGARFLRAGSLGCEAGAAPGGSMHACACCARQHAGAERPAAASQHSSSCHGAYPPPYTLAQKPCSLCGMTVIFCVRHDLPCFTISPCLTEETEDDPLELQGMKNIIYHRRIALIKYRVMLEAASLLV